MAMFPSVLTYIVGKKNGTATVKVFLKEEDSAAKDHFHRIFDNYVIEFVNIKTRIAEQLEKSQPYQSEPQLDIDIKKRLSEIIKRQGRKLLTSHSTITRISKGYIPEGKLLGKPCIIIHCLDKTLIPFGEQELPYQLEGYPVYIKESVIMFGCGDGCQSLRKGCSIGTPLDSTSGSIGFFIKVRRPGTLEEKRGFLTAAHVALPTFQDFYKENKFFSEHNLGNNSYEIVHPSKGDSNLATRIGMVSEAFCGTLQQNGIGIDAAFVNTYEEYAGNEHTHRIQ